MSKKKKGPIYIKVKNKNVYFDLYISNILFTVE